MDIDFMSVIPKAVGVIILVVIILLLLSWGGLVKCADVPFLCDVYYFFTGSPKVLIVHGSEGLGDPVVLKDLMLNHQVVGAEYVHMQDIDRVALGNLKGYKLVIVEKAKEMSSDELKMFMDYVNLNGGRLVWIGDAGTEIGEDDLNYLPGTIVEAAEGDGDEEESKEEKQSKELQDAIDHKWARVKETDSGYVITDFGSFLGLRYVGNYCDLTGNQRCTGELFTVGALEPEQSREHPLIYGAAARFPLKIKGGRDFSVVKSIPSSNTNIVMTLDFGGNQMGIGGETFGKIVPFIVASNVGERVAYYAYPPEYMVEDNEAVLIIEKMYYGMLEG